MRFALMRDFAQAVLLAGDAVVVPVEMGPVTGLTSPDGCGALFAASVGCT